MSQMRRFTAMRRAYGLAAGASLSFFLVVIAEADHMFYIVDDAVVGVLGLVVLLILLAKRNESKLSSLRSQSNLFAVLLLIGYLVKLAWVAVEIHDPDAVGDDFSSIVFLIVLLANRFL